MSQHTHILNHYAKHLQWIRRSMSIIAQCLKKRTCTHTHKDTASLICPIFLRQVNKLKLAQPGDIEALWSRHIEVLLSWSVSPAVTAQALPSSLSMNSTIMGMEEAVPSLVDTCSGADLLHSVPMDSSAPKAIQITLLVFTFKTPGLPDILKTALALQCFLNNLRSVWQVLLVKVKHSSTWH